MQHISEPESSCGSWWLIESEAANYKWNMSVDHKDGTITHRGRRAAQNGCCTTYRCLHRGQNRAESWIRGGQKMPLHVLMLFKIRTINKNDIQQPWSETHQESFAHFHCVHSCENDPFTQQSGEKSVNFKLRPAWDWTFVLYVSCKQGLNSPDQRKQLWSRCRAASCPCEWPPSLYCTHGAACRTGEPVSDGSATKTSLQLVDAGSTGQKTQKAEDIRTSKSLRCS